MNRFMINQNSLLSNLTIVVISLNRQNYIQRQIQFWSRTSVNLLIVDGSKTQADLDLGAKISSKIRYVHSPGSYRDRSLLAAGLIETEYVAQLADDEFFIPSALSEFVEALQEDSSIDAIQGRTVRFFEKNGSMIGARQYEDFRDDLGCNVRGIEGVKSFWSDNYVINYPIYSVMRVSVYVKMIRSTYSNPCENAYGYEIRYNLLFPFWFTTKVFNTLFWLRSNENDPISDIGFDRSSRFSSWFLNPNNREEKNLFLSPYADGPINFTTNPDGSMNISNLSRFGRSFSLLRIPYSFKLLIQELQVMNINMIIITDENVDQLLNMSYSNFEDCSA